MLGDDREKEAYCKQLLLKERYQSWTEEEKDMALRVFMTVPTELSLVLKQVKDLRNDLNHFGMRPNPGQASNLKDGLSKYYEKTVKCINEMLGTREAEEKGEEING